MNSRDSLPDRKSAAQQKHAPRPLPLFLELVRIVTETRPELAARALEGLARYEAADRPDRYRERPALLRSGSASLRDCGGSGPPVVLVPSLINPPRVLDLDDDTSLADAVARMGRTVLLVDWGEAGKRSDLDLAGHVQTLLLPLMEQLDEQASLVGYCLGGTMAIAAANLTTVESVTTLAAPWNFSRYPADARHSLGRLWENSQDASRRLGALPMEVLQGAFWSLDPERTVTKFARLADLPPGSEGERRFVALEDWANEGEPLPFPAARELIEDLFGADLPGQGNWRAGSRTLTDNLHCPLLNVTASGDRITPSATAPAGETVQIGAGHVGMIVGAARHELHRVLKRSLAS